MGKPSNARPYRDDPSLDDAVSLHTTPDFDDAPELRTTETDTMALPPPYQDDEDNQQDRYQNASTLPHNQYRLGDLDVAQTLEDGTKVLIGAFQGDPKAMEANLRRWAEVPPAKMIHIRGSHTETTKNGDKKEQKSITDFDLKLRLTEYLFTHPGRNAWIDLRTVENSEKTYRGTVFKKANKIALEDVERVKPSLKEWCHMYDASHSKLKKYVTRIRWRS
jgi:hypothetical protein